MESVPVPKPASIRSVASNSSIASGVSLSRRPRTRARSRTLTGASGNSALSEDFPQSPPAHSDLPYITGEIVQEPLEDLLLSSTALPPARPPKSLQRVEVVEHRANNTASSQEPITEDLTFVEPRPSASVVSNNASKTVKPASNIPLLDTTFKSSPSAFSRDPSLTPNNVRDSVSTQQSGISSSLYPPSTSTASAPESPSSPKSIAAQLDVPPFNPEVNEVQEYDSDDVSYRLRLLVKNNYFLPPAHSKPSPSEFASTSVNVPRKISSPTFLDIFRVGKSKSKPSTPTAPSSGFDPTVPMLRTTGDSIAASYALQQPRSSSQFPHINPHINPTARGRVVVVREKVNNIAVAAKQAEQDLKARAVRVETGSQKANPVVVDDVIDPTDAVDIPLPSPSYPFAVQASALHGLGVLESVGADILADRLPPSKSPNASSSYDAAEDSWRKALLHEAVHHSLDTTPDASSFSHILATSTPISSPRLQTSNTIEGNKSPSPSATQVLLQKKIQAVPLIESVSPSSSIKRGKSTNSSTSTSMGGESSGKLIIPQSNTQNVSRPSSYLPQRVDTPSGPMTPLGPPPRRHFVNPLYSLSQTDLSTTTPQPPKTPSGSEKDLQPSLRRTVSSPSLAEGYETALSRQSIPPMPAFSRDSQATVTSYDTIRGYEPTDSVLSDTHSLDSFNGGFSRTSLALSALMSRPSLSEYSEVSLSPTTSTFQEMLNHGYNSTSPIATGPSRFSLEQQEAPRSSMSTSRSAMSPPPRLSSSLAHAALPPPPRSSSLAYKAGQSSQIPPSVSSHSSFVSLHQLDAEISLLRNMASENNFISPRAISERQSPVPHADLSLDLSSTNLVRIESAPGPSSPTSFFDSIQSQPNAMDDLESSSDESEEEDEEGGPMPIPTQHLFADPRIRAVSSAAVNNPRPQIMRHGNFSTPYLRPGETFRQNLLPLGNVVNSRQAIANNPQRPKNEPLPPSSFDFFKFAQEKPPTFSSVGPSSESRRPSTADQVGTWRNTQKAQESFKKLDGMLIQHMVDEKDTIKRIATNLKQTGDSTRTNTNLNATR